MKNLVVIVEGSSKPPEGIPYDPEANILRTSFNALFATQISKLRNASNPVKLNFEEGYGFTDCRETYFNVKIENEPNKKYWLLLDSDKYFDAERTDAVTFFDTIKQKQTKEGRGLADMGLKDDELYFMVREMEAWLIADLEGLCSFLGLNYDSLNINVNDKIEILRKSDVKKILDNTFQRSGNPRHSKYKKIEGLKAVAKLNTQTLRERLPNFQRFITALESL